MDLVKVFQSVSSTLEKNCEALNQADTTSHNHGDDMVRIFHIITDAVQEKKTESAGDQLLHASSQLKKKGKTETARLYAGSLQQAAKVVSSAEWTSESTINFIRALVGIESDSQSTRSKKAKSQKKPADKKAKNSKKRSSKSVDHTVSDTILKVVGGDPNQDGAQFGLADIMQVGMDYLKGKTMGQNDGEALAGALLLQTQVVEKQHRAASGQVVAYSLLEAFRNMTK